VGAGPPLISFELVEQLTSSGRVQLPEIQRYLSAIKQIQLGVAGHLGKQTKAQRPVHA
jgi:hypothetical protein